MTITMARPVNMFLITLILVCSTFCNAASNADAGHVKSFRAHMKPLHPHNITSTQHHLRGAFHRSIKRLKAFETSVTSAIFKAAHAKSISASSPSQIEAPVTLGNGAFLMTINIGSPAKRMIGIMDTGSDLLWTQCKPCVQCFTQPDPIFDPSNSTTYNKVPCAASLCSALPDPSCTPDCEYLYQYGDGSSTRGVLSSDTLTMSDTSGGQQSIPGVAFGCSHDTEGNDFTGTDGLVGLGRGDLSLISQLGSLVESKFSYCLMSVANTTPSDSSPLFFGRAAQLGKPAKSTPMLTNSVLPELNTYYYISLEGISVGNSLANISEGMFDIKADGSGGFIIDSGTTITFLPHEAFTAVADLLDSAIGLPRGDASYEGLSLCYKLGSSTNVSLPDMTFHFGGGADYVIKGDYNFGVDEQANLLCLLMLDTGDSAFVPSIFGNYQQQNYHILYDNAKQMLSFAPTDCTSL